jgi:hypothetical protein
MDKDQDNHEGVFWLICLSCGNMEQEGTVEI